MTDAELDELLSDCPTLYHMAEGGAWDGISAGGLLSTTALLDRCQYQGETRAAIEQAHRPSGVDLIVEGRIVARVRDQIPMSDGGLLRALPNSITPSDWYRVLNEKVFFWLTRERLHRLLGAKAYREREQDVLEVDARQLVEAYGNSIWFCPINSGCTKPFPRYRDMDTFQRIATYPYSEWRAKRRSGERVVELAVDYAVPDILKFTKRVVRMKGGVELATLYER